MKSWKTTIAGILAGLAALQTAISNGADLANPATWILPVAIALIGFVAKDFNATGTP